MMSDVFYLRQLSPAVRLEDLPAMAEAAEGCFGLYRVDWQMSFLSLDGSEMLCWYRAPDAESARIALRQIGADMAGVWPGRADPPLEPAAGPLADVSVLAAVPVAVTAETPDAVREAVASRGGEVVSRIDSLDGSRSVWLFRSVGIGDVTEAFRMASLSGAQVWGCRVFIPG